ncbi:translocated intimin receptor Tir, partial [Salmonella enterica]|nr:translocated intimin receptor Tir [Salmonella enterica]
MPIINGNNSAAVPVAPPLPNSNSASSLRNGAGHGQPQQTITSSGALSQRSTLTPLSPAPGTSSSAGNVSHLPSSPRNLTLPSTVTLHNELEVTNDWSSLNLLHNDIGSRGFRTEKSSDGTVHAIGEKDGKSYDRVLSPEEVEGLAAIGSGNDRFVFSGNRGGAGHVMVTAASDFGLAREAIVKKLDR